MNTDITEGVDLASNIMKNVPEYDKEKFNLIIAPPFTHLYPVRQVIDNDKVELSAQNLAFAEKGAFTGEISASMIKSVGAKHVIIGHSERRKYFKETPEMLLQKVSLALQNDLTPIFCIGEELEQREAGKHFDVVRSQLEEVVFMLHENEFSKIILAYEPVWAIGTGKTATPEQAQEIHEFIRSLIEEKYRFEIARNTTILYGGSCKPSNAAGLFEKQDIDGGLIGGASLKADDFLEIFRILQDKK